jgi:predicted membrane protein
MSGIGRTSDAADFRGADLFALMGGCKLDLRQATIAGNEAVIDVFVMMGGIELRVPETWSIDARVLPLMGGISDERRPSAPAGTETQRLVIRGTVLMGGVEIKN